LSFLCAAHLFKWIFLRIVIYLKYIFAFISMVLYSCVGVGIKINFGQCAAQSKAFLFCIKSVYALKIEVVSVLEYMCLPL